MSSELTLPITSIVYGKEHPSKRPHRDAPTRKEQRRQVRDVLPLSALQSLAKAFPAAKSLRSHAG